MKSRALVITVFVGEKVLGNGKQFKLFVLGDSVGAGVGATSFEKSVVGRVANELAKNHQVHLINNSVSGYQMKDVLEAPPPSEKQDVLLIIAGSNNLFHFTNLKAFSTDTGNVLKKFSPLASKVILVGPGRVFDADAIPFFLKPIYKIQGKKYAQILKEEAGKFGSVEYVNPLSTEISHDKYGATSASDNFHPNDEGHRFWFDLISPNFQRNN